MTKALIHQTLCCKSDLAISLLPNSLWGLSVPLSSIGIICVIFLVDVVITLLIVARLSIPVSAQMVLSQNYICCL